MLLSAIDSSGLDLVKFELPSIHDKELRCDQSNAPPRRNLQHGAHYSI